MKTFLKISAILLLLVSTTSCFYNGVKGNGNVITQNRKISNDFVRIKASKGLDVYITKSDKVTLVVEADENLHDLIQTDVINGTLIITSKKNIGFAKAKKIHLSVENINEILVSSGAEIYSENTLFSDELRINATSGSEAKLTLNVANLTCETSSGADIRLYGKVVNFNASSSSGSDIKAYDLETENCVAKASSGSNIRVSVSDSFDGKASSGADINYKGNPKIIDKDKSSGGSIRNTQG